jgi:ribosomal protein S18 acetylase RimI-like enzyme
VTVRVGAATLAAVPVASDASRSLEMIRVAVRQREGVGEEADRQIRRFEEVLHDGQLHGFLAEHGGRAVGIAVWQEPVGVGATLDLLYLADPLASPERYGELLTLAERSCGPVAFVSGPLAGLDPHFEAVLMQGLGYAPFGRSEMRLAHEPAPRPARENARLHLRPMELRDEPQLGELHARAYRGRLDRYLFWNDADDATDGAKHTSDLLSGRWGLRVELGSWVGEEDGQLVGAVLSVRTDLGVLIADVMVDPARQGQGIGRAVLLASLSAMTAGGEGPVFLNVTEGNLPAIRLYESVGFVRSLGPTHDWYNTRRVPVRPPVPY